MKRLAVIALVAWAPLLGSACRCEPTPDAGPKTSLPIAASGPQVLAFRGNVYNIITTYYVASPDSIQFTIEYEVPSSIDVIGISDERAYEVAYPLMRGAVEHGWQKRMEIKRIAGATPPVSRIGVVLYSNGSRSRGTRVARDIKTIEAGP
jgi:hypothetical protein